MKITATVVNDIIRLPPGVHLPNGTRVTLVASGVSEAEQLTDALLEIADGVKNLPADLAAQHDHYLHGHPKR